MANDQRLPNTSCFRAVAASPPHEARIPSRIRPPFWIALDFRLALERWPWLIVTWNWQMYWASVAQLDRASDFGSEGSTPNLRRILRVINSLQIRKNSKDR